MARPIPIRRSLLVGALAAILILGGGILGLTMWGSRRAIERVANSVVVHSVQSLDAQLGGFFEPVRSNLFMFQAWGNKGLLDFESPEEFRRFFVPFLRHHSQVSSLMVADDSGRELMLLQLDGRWLARETRRHEWGTRARVLEWSDGQEPVASWQELDYDPRVRPWYVGAKKADGKEHWTEPYTFFTTKDPGITASVTFGAGKRVIGLDVLLNDVSNFTGRLADGRRMVFVMTSDRRVVGLPSGIPADARKPLYLKKPEDLGIPAISDVSEQVGSKGSTRADTLAAETSVAARFRSGGEHWWGAAAPYRLSGDLDPWWICTVLPESQLLPGVLEMRIWIIGLTVVVLLGGILAATRFARRFSRPIEALVRESDRISEGNLDKVESIESRVTEVTRLAEAHDRMRASLQVLFKLEQDLRIARQIQHDTFPEKIPVLAGYDIAGWSGPADETGGDTYDVIGLIRENGAVQLSQDKAERVLLLLADATGHGVGPALSVTQVRAMLRMAVRSGADLASIARDMNDQLCADLEAGRFITTWLAELDPETHELASFSAGQGPLLRYCAADDTFEEIKSNAPPLGIMPTPGYTLPDPIALAPRDMFVVLSDGFFEEADKTGEQFGSKRVEAIVREHRAQTAAAIIVALRTELERFTENAPASDDRTAVIVKRL